MRSSSNAQGPVVQIIVSLTLLVENLLTLIAVTKPVVVIVFALNCKSLLHCKSSSHF